MDIAFSHVGTALQCQWCVRKTRLLILRKHNSISASHHLSKLELVMIILRKLERMDRTWLIFVTSYFPYHLLIVKCYLIAGQKSLHLAGQLLSWQKGKVLALSLQQGHIQSFPSEVPSRQTRRVHTNPLSYVPYLILEKCSCIHSPEYSGNAGLCQHSNTLQEQLVNSSLPLGFSGRRRFLGWKEKVSGLQDP